MKIRPEHFDWLGFGAFIYILGYAIYVAITDNMPSDIATYALIIIAFIGAIVDGTIIYRFFLRK